MTPRYKDFANHFLQGNDVPRLPDVIDQELNWRERHGMSFFFAKGNHRQAQAGGDKKESQITKSCGINSHKVAE